MIVFEDTLSKKQRQKVRDNISNDCTNVKAFFEEKDTREGSQSKENYGCIRIEFKKNNKQYKTLISAQIGNRH